MRLIENVLSWRLHTTVGDDRPFSTSRRHSREVFARLHRVFPDLHLAIEVVDVFSQVQQLGMVPPCRIGELPRCQRRMLGQADSPGPSLGCWSYQGQGLAPRLIYEVGRDRDDGVVGAQGLVVRWPIWWSAAGTRRFIVLIDTHADDQPARGSHYPSRILYPTATQTPVEIKNPAFSELSLVAIRSPPTRLRGAPQ